MSSTCFESEVSSSERRLHIQVPYGTVRDGTVQHVILRNGTVRNGMVWYVTVRHCTVRYGTERYGTVRYGTARYGTVRNSKLRYGIVWSTLQIIVISPCETHWQVQHNIPYLYTKHTRKYNTIYRTCIQNHLSEGEIWK